LHCRSQCLVEKLHHQTTEVTRNPFVKDRTQEITQRLWPRSKRTHCARIVALRLDQRQEPQAFDAEIPEEQLDQSRCLHVLGMQNTEHIAVHVPLRQQSKGAQNLIVSRTTAGVSPVDIVIAGIPKRFIIALPTRGTCQST
jgi:hypothetical protein